MNPESVDLSTKTFAIYDHGPSIHIARALGKKAKKAYYYLADEHPNPQKLIDGIGRGFEEIEVVSDWDAAVEKSDVAVFTDVYNEGKDVALKNRGIPVFSSLRSEVFETNRRVLRKFLQKAGLPIIPYKDIEGISKCRAYLRDKTDKYLKTLEWRGDMETEHYIDYFTHSQWFRDMAAKLEISPEPEGESFPLIIEDPIESECETGFDTPMLNGEIPAGLFIGYEAKGEGYVSQFVEALPEIWAKAHKAMAPGFKRMGYQAWYSTEGRIAKDGTLYVNDITCRFGSPPSEVQSEQAENFAETIWSLAHGELIPVKAAKKYGVQLNLYSTRYKNHTLPVSFPKEIDQWIKLKNATRLPAGDVLIPNEYDGYMGSVIAIDDDLETAKEMIKDRVEQIKCIGLEYDINCFESIQDTIAAGEKHGINFGG